MGLEKTELKIFSWITSKPHTEKTQGRHTACSCNKTYKSPLLSLISETNWTWLVIVQYSIQDKHWLKQGKLDKSIKYI